MQFHFVLVCVSMCVHVGGLGLRVAKTHNCRDAPVPIRLGSCLTMKQEGFGVIFLYHLPWAPSPASHHPTPPLVLCKTKNCSSDKNLIIKLDVSYP